MYPLSSSRVIDVLWYSRDRVSFSSSKLGCSMPRGYTVQKRSTSNSSALWVIMTLWMLVEVVDDELEHTGSERKYPSFDYTATG